MTPKEAAAHILPSVKLAVNNAHDEMRQEVGPVKWALLKPVWAIVEALLPIFTRIGVEVAAMEAKEHVGDEISAIASLINTPKSDMHPGVQRLV